MKHSLKSTLLVALVLPAAVFAQGPTHVVGAEVRICRLTRDPAEGTWLGRDPGPDHEGAERRPGVRFQDAGLATRDVRRVPERAGVDDRSAEGTERKVDPGEAGRV